MVTQSDRQQMDRDRKRERERFNAQSEIEKGRERKIQGGEKDALIVQSERLERQTGSTSSEKETGTDGR